LRRADDGRGDVGVGNGRRAFVDVDVIFVIVAGVVAAEAPTIVLVVGVSVTDEAEEVGVVSIMEDEKVSKLELGSGV
jgi:hypothetical protein